MEKYAACALYNTNGDVLLQFRSKDQKRPYCWAFFGGHVLDGESIEHAVVREIKEELNIELKSYDLVGTFPTEHGNIIHLFVAPYTGKVSEITVLEGSGFCFFPLLYALEKLELPLTTREGLLRIKDQKQIVGF